MALSFVEAQDEQVRARAAELAKRWGVPLVGPGQTAQIANGVKVVVGPTGLSLGFVDAKKGKPYVVDFLSTGWRSRFQQPLARSHIFRRALGVREESLRIVDATAGFAQDALLALSLGCKVIAIERNPVVAALVGEAVERAGREDVITNERLKNFTLVCAEAVDYLASLTDDLRPDVIYLDPMFDKPKKTAKSPKAMQLLQELLHNTDSPSALSDDEALFAAALRCARYRVVVKRPLKAKAFKGGSGFHSFKGQSVRYDVHTTGTH